MKVGNTDFKDAGLIFEFLHMPADALDNGFGLPLQQLAQSRAARSSPAPAGVAHIPVPWAALYGF